MANLLFLKTTECGEISEKTKNNLLLDGCIRMICPNPQKSKIFMDVLSQPLLTEESIYYRQNILQDFVKHPQLLSELIELFEKFEDLKNQFDTARKNGSRFLGQKTSNGDIHGIQNLLKMNALILKRTLILLKTIGNLLNAYNVTSRGLITLKEAIQTIVSPKEFEDLLGLCTHFEQMSQTAPVAVLTRIDETGKISECYLSNPIFQKKEQHRKRLLFNKSTNKNPIEHVVFQRKNNTVFQALLSTPYKELIDALGNIYKQIHTDFSGCYVDLQYYSVAVRYCRFLIENGIEFAYPKISSTQETRLLGVQDLFLILNNKTPETVVANDYLPKSSHNTGTVIFGKNSGGKTVFLRSIGITQIFGQVGLPVVAQSATIHCYHSIITQFAESEKDGKEAQGGRFEQEVQEMARLLDAVTKNSLVLLNEVFQSTSYDEGSSCLCVILDYLSSVPSKWILVSHLKQIRSLLPFDTMFLTTEDGYKLIQD